MPLELQDIRANEFIPSKFGLGDILQSLFFSPKTLTSGGWIWGARPVMLYPSATDSALGAGKWRASPMALLLKQQNGWTFCTLANHTWSYAGWGTMRSTPPICNRSSPSPPRPFTTFGVSTESTYDWANNQWTVPMSPSVSQLLKGWQTTHPIQSGREVLCRETQRRLGLGSAVCRDVALPEMTANK